MYAALLRKGEIVERGVASNKSGIILRQSLKVITLTASNAHLLQRKTRSPSLVKKER